MLLKPSLRQSKTKILYTASLGIVSLTNAIIADPDSKLIRDIKGEIYEISLLDVCRTCSYWNFTYC